MYVTTYCCQHFRILLNLPSLFYVVSLAKTKLVYSWSTLQPGASKCEVLLYDDAMAQYMYKGVKLSYNHSKFVSRMYDPERKLKKFLSVMPFYSKSLHCSSKLSEITCNLLSRARGPDLRMPPKLRSKLRRNY